MRSAAILVLTLVAFGLRCHALGAVGLRWDEGWSIALARLGPGELARLTALDVHPPLYYLLLAPWLARATAPEFWLRFPGVLAGTLAVPLAALAAEAWWAGGRRVATPGTARPVRAGLASPTVIGLAAAGAVACAPALVYYAGVTRMYALTTPLLLLATWGLARVAMGGGMRSAAAAILGATAALYTFYYTGFALAGLFVAALLAWPRAWRGTLAIGLVTALLVAPWLAVAAPGLLARSATGPGGGEGPLATVLGLADDGLNGALFVAARPAAYSLGLVALAVAGAALFRPARPARLGVVLLPVLAGLAGAALGAGLHMFAPRYVIVVTPFLALGLGYGLAGFWQRSVAAGLVASAVAILAVAPLYLSPRASADSPAGPVPSGYVYQRLAEVTDAFDPAEAWRALAPRTGPADVVAFNILNLAGLYQRYRTADDPPWTYAQLWDPVHEPEDGARRRLADAAAAHDRLWLVLYQGSWSPDSGAIKRWADTTLYPLEGAWHGDTQVQGYLAARPEAGARTQAVAADFGHGLRLVGAALPSQARPDQGVGIDLTWQADGVPDAKARVFVHLYDRQGRLVAQHDGFPVADTRPQTTWSAGERVVDRHGLWVPAGASGPLTVTAGLYDPATGERWRTAEGEDAVAIGRLAVAAR
jgi:hypothetical protein